MNRQPAVAGTFYPAGKEELSSLLASYFSGANQVLNVQPIAVIVPHAGYVYSGSLAAWAYKQIDREKKFKHIFLIGSSHTNYFKGASIFTAGDFITPLGTVTLDSLAVSLHKTLNYNNDDIGIHAKEHSLEVQLPFLQYWLKHEFSIVPIIIGGDAVETSRKLAETLKPYFTSENLFIISSDFSHYPKYEDANASDKAMAEAILTNSSKIFLKAKATKESSNITNLVTAACGWTSILTLLDITEDKKDVKYQLVKYQNSGDAAIGGKDRVVGYNAICAFKIGTTEVEKTFQLTDEEKFALLKLARKTIQDQIVNSEYNRVSPASYSQNLQADLGAFVTLKKHGELRGCIGNFKPGQPLVKTIQDMAISSATHDYRFSPVEPDEISQLEIEISLLTPMKKINSIDEIELGRHGIYIKKGNSAGTFLPQVATETKWNKEEFLGHCARDKAFIGWDGWKSADIYIYEAIVFSESDFK
jgi:AmmeMemoRadiSam system protein B/AmmeMemoRadiSam system protein A